MWVMIAKAIQSIKVVIMKPFYKLHDKKIEEKERKLFRTPFAYNESDEYFLVFDCNDEED